MTQTCTRPTLPSVDDANSVARLQRREEAALTELVRLHQRSMTRVAQHYVRDSGTAEEVVQETWLVVFNDIDQFQGRGSLKNWIYAILINLARARGKRDARVIPVGFGSDTEADAPKAATLHAEMASGALRPPWGANPRAHRLVEQCLADCELLDLIVQQIAALPVGQRAVIYLRDIRGVGPKEVCDILTISDGAQRVQLHRARNRVRAAIAPYLAVDGGQASYNLNATGG